MNHWNSTKPNLGTIHCLGNGRLCAYGRGPNLLQVFGPPYSAPAFYKLLLSTERPVEVVSSKEAHTAIWTHQMYIEQEQVAEIRDWVDAELPCLIRKIQTSVPLTFQLKTIPDVKAIDNSSRLLDRSGLQGMLLEAPAGTRFYHTYPYPFPCVHQLAWTEGIQKGPDGQLIASPGLNYLSLTGGPSYPQAVENFERAAAQPAEDSLEKTRRAWISFSAKGSAIADSLDPHVPLRDTLIRVIDDTAIVVKVQQSELWTVIAGHPYHLGYVRDQYGVARGLLSMGYVEEAKKNILGFYWNIWQRHGRIHNAQAAGVDGVFHVHENDCSEIPGYLILQAFDLLQAGAEDEWIREIFPMLEWAWEAQKSQLVDSMLPFNGDETYIAGGILPRSVLNDGSAEASMLFHESGKRLLDWVEQHDLWSAERQHNDRQVLQAVRQSYRDNFWQDGNLIANQPRRRFSATLPRFRHGVCERCIENGIARGIEWTERNEEGRYLCTTCINEGPYPAAPPQSYLIQSVSLVLAYVSSGLIPAQDLLPNLNLIKKQYFETGRLPSRPDDDRGLTVGYDYGLLLYSLAKAPPAFFDLGQQLYEKTLSLAIPGCGWNEYYAGDLPQGTFSRPWESAINMEALLQWAALATASPRQSSSGPAQSSGAAHVGRERGIHPGR